MRFNRRLVRDLSAALLACTTIAAVRTAQTPELGAATFVIMLRGVRIGFETVSLLRTPGGWLITSGGQLQAPFDMLTTRFELQYGPDWQPRELAIEGVLQGQLVNMTTSFDGKTATTSLLKGDARASSAVPVSPGAVVLPANFFGAYEALAAQIGAMTPGTAFRAYLAPEIEVPATVDRITTRRIALPDGAVEVREFAMTLVMPTGRTPVEIWTDGRHRLVRASLPNVGLLAMREDVATVLAREEHIRNPGDESLFVPAAGFSLGATITSPVAASAVAGRRPAIVLVSGPGPQDRDYTALGPAGTLPIFGQLAGRLADLGYIVVRYDGRGVGQSGGRTENATLDDYAQDVVQVVNWLRRRRDVDADRLVAVGYAEAASVALLAARREDRIRGVALLAAPAVSGRTLALEQQMDLLDRLKVSPAERAERIALQHRVLDATISGKGWENIPIELRRQADTVTFRSWLIFDPAAVISRLDQPILIAHGSLDDEIRPAHADKLEALSRGRRDVPATHTRKVLIADVSHKLARSETVSSPSTSAPRSIAPEVPTALAAWLGDVLRPR
jgi:pimeloyl-ACP methyl ester carboxylesterase